MAAAYQQALRPRLLVPVAMAALLGAINLVAEEPLPLVYQGCALGGFLSYKIALLLETFQQNSLKVGAGRAGGWAVRVRRVGCACWSRGSRGRCGMLCSTVTGRCGGSGRQVYDLCAWC